MVAKAFDEKAFEKMLNEMEHKAADVQRVAGTMETHISHAKRICHIWNKAVERAPTAGNVLVLIYVVNHVVQETRRKGLREYADLFGSKALQKAFERFGRMCQSKRQVDEIIKVLDVWATRKIFAMNFIDACANTCLSSMHGELRNAWKERRGTSGALKQAPPRRESDATPAKRLKSDEASISNSDEVDVSLNAIISLVDGLQDASTTDVRESISELPEFVSSRAYAMRIRDQAEAESLLKSVTHADRIVGEFNRELKTEYDNRLDLQNKLYYFQIKQKHRTMQVVKECEERRQTLLERMQKQRDEVLRVIDLLPDGEVAPVDVALPSAAALSSLFDGAGDRQ